MKALMMLIAIIVFGLIGTAYAQPATPFIEEFEYPAGWSLTSLGYTAHLDAGITPVAVVSGNLSFPGYPSSGLGGSVRLRTTGSQSEDVCKAFTATPVTSGSIYISFLVKVNSISSVSSMNYFFHLMKAPMTEYNYAALVFAKYAANENVAFGLSKVTSADTEHWTGGDYLHGGTYLLVVKYTIKPGMTDDEASLFVFTNAPPETEPAVPTLGPITSASLDFSQLSLFALKQGTRTPQEIIVDGLRIASSWSSAPLPVQLSSFTGYHNAASQAVVLEWSTVSEMNNYGFEVQRSSHQTDSFQTIPRSFLPGHGTTLEPKHYSYTDSPVAQGGWYYRLKQIDFDGTIHYSDAIRVDVMTTSPGEGGIPAVFSLSQNYPNPFNPSTTIRYALAHRSFVTLTVFNALGQQVARLVHEEQQAGYHDVHFRSDRLASGVYWYRLRAGDFVSTRKLVLVY